MALGGLGLALVGSLIVSLDEIARLLAGPSAAISKTPVGSAGASLLARASPATSASASGEPGERHAYRTRPDLTPPAISVVRGVAPDRSGGYLFLTPANGAGSDGPLIVDTSGEPIWVRPGSGSAVTDFKVITWEGRPALAWWEGANNNGIGAGEFVISDAGYQEIARVRAAGGLKADLHEFLLTPSATAIFFADTAVSRDDPLTSRPFPWPIMECVVQEIDLATGRLVFEWHCADHIGIDEFFVEPPTAVGDVYDYVHSNSIDLDSDGDLLVSARNTSAVYKVERATGKILWRLGGKKSDFTMAPEATFGWQHDVRRRPDGTLTLFDNANGAPPPVSTGSTTPPGQPSRALVLALDMDAMTASLVRAFAHPSPLAATSQGNMQVLDNGNVFVGWGSAPWCTEFDRAGEVVLDATFPAARQSYRDFRFAWAGRPLEPPVVAIEHLGGGSYAAYASWNGHTEVASWDVLTGIGTNSLDTAASAPRAGFETRIELETVSHVVAVRARDGLGGALGISQPIVVGS